MRNFFEPAEGPLWLKQVLSSIRSALGDIWPAPLRLKDYATVDLPAAADFGQGLAYNITTLNVTYSDGTSWHDLLTTTGTAAAATKLATARTIGITGDLTWTSPAFDGTANVTAAGTLATVNSNVGSFGSATQAGTFTVNAKGLITAAANVTITPAASSITGAAALTKTDDTNVTLTLAGSPATALLAAASLTLGWTGTLSVSRGGTGAGTVTGILQGNGTSAVTGITNSSTTGQTLRVTGVSTYGWGALDLANSSAITGTLPAGNGGTGITSLGTGVPTALGTSVGSAGAFVTFNGAGGTPSSLTLTNATGLPIAGLTASTSTAIGVGSIELGNASDTTISRAAAGDINVEGNRVYRAGGTTVPVTDGGTGRATGTTAYGLIAAGTTAAGAQQTLATGATTDILVSGGSAALPVWTTATGTGAPVRAGSPTLTGTVTAAAITASGLITSTVTAGNPSLQANQTTGSIADNGTYDFAAGSYQLFFIAETAATGATALCASDGGAVNIIWQSSGALYSSTINTANHANLYYNAGAIRIQNKRGGASTFSIILLRAVS